MKDYAFGLIASAAGAAGFMGMYTQWYIPPSSFLLVITGVLGIAYTAAAIRHIGNKNRLALLLLALSLFLVQAAGAWIYETWPFESFFSAVGMMKIMMIILGTGGLVLNVVYFISRVTNKKRSTRQPAKAGKNKIVIRLFQRKKAEKTVAVVLGESVHADRD